MCTRQLTRELETIFKKRKKKKIPPNYDNAMKSEVYNQVQYLHATRFFFRLDRQVSVILSLEMCHGYAFRRICYELHLLLAPMVQISLCIRYCLEEYCYQCVLCSLGKCSACLL